MPHCRFAGGLPLCVALLVVAAGCGTAEYEKRIADNLNTLRARALFASLHEAPMAIPGTPVQLRLPKFIGPTAKAYNESSSEPSGQGQVDPNRLFPPFAKIPGLKVTYEMQANDAAGAATPYYCYLAALPVGDMAPGAKPVEDFIREQVAAAFPNVDTSWQNADCVTPAANKVTWRRINVAGEQAFLPPQGPAKNMPGSFQIFANEIDNWRILIGWRVPDAVQGEVKLADVAPVTAGTVTVAKDAAAPAAAP